MLEIVQFLWYRTVNSAKCPASVADNVIVSWLMSQVQRVREVVCA